MKAHLRTDLCNLGLDLNGLPNTGFVWPRRPPPQYVAQAIAVMLAEFALIVSLFWNFHLNLAGESLHFSFGNKVALITHGKRIGRRCIALLLEQLQQKSTVCRRDQS